MEDSLRVLEPVLQELGISSEIASVNDRKRIQKAIYLAQLPGVDMGYRFGWYRMGPYSPSLTRDYYAIDEARRLGAFELGNAELRDDIVNRLDKIKGLLSVPPDLADQLGDADWLELVASLDYLQRVQRKTYDQAVEALRVEKEQLVDYSDLAQQQLEAAQKKHRLPSYRGADVVG